MLLTLYKDTILNDRYATVFDCDETYWGGPSNTPLMKYLSQQFKKYFDLPTVYMKESGTISVDIALPQTYDIFDYNYMSLENDEFGKRYYFIDNIELGNGIVQLTYTLDVWHTYSRKMHLNYGILGRARRNVENLKRALPVAYESNLAPIFSATTETDFYLVAEISEYVLTSDAANATIRKNFTAFLGYQPEYTETVAGSDLASTNLSRNKYANSRQQHTFTIDEAEHVVNLLTEYQGVQPQEKNITYQDTVSVGSIASEAPFPRFDILQLYSDEYESPIDEPETKNVRYDITQIYAIPKSMFSESFIKNGINEVLEMGLKFMTSTQITAQAGASPNYTFGFEDIAFYKFTDNFKGIDIHKHTISANEHTIGYGLRNMFMPLPYNGLNYELQTVAQINDLGFSIGLLAPEDGYIDLSPMFEVPLPFTTPSGVERQQQAIAKEQAKIQRVTTIAALAAPIGFSAVKGAAMSGAGSTFAAGW